MQSAATSLTDLLLAGLAFGIPLIAVLVWIRVSSRETAETKRRETWLRPFGAVPIFVVLAVITTRNWRAIWVAVPATIVILLNIRATKFCDKCNKTTYDQSRSMAFCPYCGAPFAECVKKCGPPLEE